jgi:DNA-binding transcriptional LysR family regulator
MDKITIADIKNLIAIADGQSINKLAKSLGTSQPALSKRMKNIERELGVRLFEKSDSRCARKRPTIEMIDMVKSLREAISHYELAVKGIYYAPDARTNEQRIAYHAKQIAELYGWPVS